MLKVGLTGGIATGKSTVSNMFREAEFAFIDADTVAKEVLEIYPSLIEDIKNTFGEAFFNKDGSLKRREFGNYIFKYPKERLKYENIIMPLIKDRITELFKEYEIKGEKLVILDAPTLIENNLQEDMDYVILVWVSKSEQIKRLINRNSFNYEEAINRIESQISLEHKKVYSDFIIDNSNSLQVTKDQVMELVKLLHILACK